MPTLKVPGGLGEILFTGTQEEADRAQRVLDGRRAFTVTYCRSKGWPEDGAQLSIDQIMEIRSQDGWKNPLPDDAGVGLGIRPRRDDERA